MKHHIIHISRIPLSVAEALAFVVTVSYASIAIASGITPEKVVELTNKDRTANGIEVLQTNETLTRAAQAKANDMVKNLYFAHTSPAGVTPWHWIQESGYDYRLAGENLAIRFTSAEEEQAAWMKSVKHRENILNPKYQDIGVAVASTVYNGQSTTVVVQMFGLPSHVVAPMQSELPTTENVTSQEPIFFSEALLNGALSKHQAFAQWEAALSGEYGLALIALIATLLLIGNNAALVWMSERMVAYKIFHLHHH